MNSSAFTLLTSATIALVSIVVGVTSYRTLERENVGLELSLGRVSSTPNSYYLVESSAPQRCFGTLSLSVAPAAGQTTVNVKGWVLVGLNDHVEPINLEATMLFNALGQLSVSLLNVTLSRESLRLGTIGVHPITVQLYRASNGDKPLVEHSISGPVTLSLRDGLYRLHTPALPGLPGVNDLPNGAGLLTDLSVTLSDEGMSCEIDTAHHIDLSSLTKAANALQRAIPGVLSGL
jgi:hypothetical protein